MPNFEKPPEEPKKSKNTNLGKVSGGAVLDFRPDELKDIFDDAKEIVEEKRRLEDALKKKGLAPEQITELPEEEQETILANSEEIIRKKRPRQRLTPEEILENERIYKEINTPKITATDRRPLPDINKRKPVLINPTPEEIRKEKEEQAARQIAGRALLFRRSELFDGHTRLEIVSEDKAYETGVDFEIMLDREDRPSVALNCSLGVSPKSNIKDARMSAYKEQVKKTFIDSREAKEQPEKEQTTENTPIDLALIIQEEDLKKLKRLGVKDIEYRGLVSSFKEDVAIQLHSIFLYAISVHLDNEIKKEDGAKHKQKLRDILNNNEDDFQERHTEVLAYLNNNLKKLKIKDDPIIDNVLYVMGRLSAKNRQVEQIEGVI